MLQLIYLRYIEELLHHSHGLNQTDLVVISYHVLSRHILFTTLHPSGFVALTLNLWDIAIYPISKSIHAVTSSCGLIKMISSLFMWKHILFIFVRIHGIDFKPSSMIRASSTPFSQTSSCIPLAGIYLACPCHPFVSERRSNIIIACSFSTNSSSPE